MNHPELIIPRVIREKLWVSVMHGPSHPPSIMPLTSVTGHMAFTRGTKFFVQEAAIRTPEGEYQNVWYWSQGDYAFCLEMETHEPDMSEGFQNYGGGRNDCCDDNFRLAPSSLALCREIVRSFPLWFGWKAKVWKNTLELEGRKSFQPLSVGL